MYFLSKSGIYCPDSFRPFVQAGSQNAPFPELEIKFVPIIVPMFEIGCED